jgi:phage baseplate assembly protein W
MQFDYPYHFDDRGRTAGTSPEDHVRDMIEQVLFTSPGERVNRPEFGSGLLQLLFAPVGPEIRTALQFTVQGALQRWLGDVIEPRKVEVDVEDSQVRVKVEYAIRGDDVGVRVATFTREVQS